MDDRQTYGNRKSLRHTIRLLPSRLATVASLLRSVNTTRGYVRIRTSCEQPSNEVITQRSGLRLHDNDDRSSSWQQCKHLACHKSQRITYVIYILYKRMRFISGLCRCFHRVPFCRCGLAWFATNCMNGYCSRSHRLTD